MSPEAIPGPLRVAGMIAAALLVAVAVLAPGERLRARAMLGALLLTPVLLLAELWGTPQLAALRDRPVLALAAAGAGLGLVTALGVLFARRPAAFALLAVAALPFRVPVESGGTTANLLVPLYAVIGAGALAWLVPRLGLRTVAPAAAPGEPRAAHGDLWLERLLLGGVVLYAVASAWSSDTGKALEQVVFFYVPFALLFALLRELDWTPRLVLGCFGVLLGLAVLFAAVGYVEYQSRSLLLNPKVIASNQVEPYFRVNSLFFDPNIYGRFLAIVMIGLAAVLLWARAPRTIALTVVALAVLWGGLVLTLSQSSFASLVVGLVVLAALRFRTRTVVLAAGAAAVLGVVLILALPGVLRLELGSDGALDDATSGRATLLAGGIGLAAERPVLGWGSGSFAREYRRQERASGPRAVAASHTIPVTVAAEQGLVGLALYVALLVAVARRLLPGARASAARAAAAAAFAALVAHTWIYAAYLEDPMAWALLAVGSALAAAAPRATRRPRASEAGARVAPAPPREPAPALP